MNRRIGEIFGDDKPQFSTGAAAKLAGCSVPTLRRYLKAGLIDPFKFPSGIRKFSRNEVIEILRIYQENMGI